MLSLKFLEYSFVPSWYTHIASTLSSFSTNACPSSIVMLKSAVDKASAFAESSVMTETPAKFSAGNNVTINFNLDNNQEFGVLTARIIYDNTKLTYVDSKLTGLKKSPLHGVEHNNDKGLVVVYGITLNEDNLMNDNGSILTIEFKINDNVTEDIPLTLEIKDFGIDENTSLEYITKDGVIHITNNVETISPKESIINKIKEQLKEQGIDSNELILESSNDEVAIVTEDGNIELKKDGNTTIIAKDKDGNIIYEKDYFVKKEIKKYNKYIIIGIIIIIISISLIIIWRKKCKRKK